MPYYGLLIRNRDLDTWSYEFGSYDKSDVDYEIQDYRDHDYRLADLKMIRFKHCPSSKDIDLLVADTNR